MSKLKIEDQCLTEYQVYIFNKNGIKIKNPTTLILMYLRDRYGNEVKGRVKITHYIPYSLNGFEKIQTIPTMTNTELIELLPKVVTDDIEYRINIHHDSINWIVEYRSQVGDKILYSCENPLLRDSLFSMVIYMVTNYNNIKI